MTIGKRSKPKVRTLTNRRPKPTGGTRRPRSSLTKSGPGPGEGALSLEYYRPATPTPRSGPFFCYKTLCKITKFGGSA